MPPALGLLARPLQAAVLRASYSSSAPQRRASSGARAAPVRAFSAARAHRAARRRQVTPRAAADAVIVGNDEDQVLAEIRRLQSENDKLKSELVGTSAAPAAPGTANGDVLDVEATAVDAKAPAAGAEEDEYSLPDQVVLKAEKTYNIVFVTSEVTPWSKTGGLADVAGALPQALVKRGHRVMVIAPRYYNVETAKRYEGAFDTNVKRTVNIFGGTQEVGYFHQIKDGVDFVFVDHISYHRPGTPYGDVNGTFGDNLFRYTLLSHAACEAPLVLNLNNRGSYGDACIFIANDWHAGLVPSLVASRYRPHVYRDARCIFAIHNLLHQGVEPFQNFGSLGMPDDWWETFLWVYPEHMRAHELDKGETVNLMKAAFLTSDRLLTVSSNYAYEITTPEGGCGLESVLQSRMNKLNGIVNGIDLDEWNPATDPDIPANYDIRNLDGKAACKAALQKELGLPERPNVPLVGFIGRLDWQKGPELIAESIDRLMNQDIQLVMLGAGRPDLEDFLKWAEGAHHDRFRGWVGFSVQMAHRVTAGCDILLMPSRFEPCGLNQLYAMRYGTVPVVHATGGLKDTVQPYSDVVKGLEGMGTGFLFSPPSPESLMSALTAATRVYHDKPERWRMLQRSCMRQDFSWNKAALQYEQLFEWAKMDPPHCA